MPAWGRQSRVRAGRGASRRRPARCAGFPAMLGLMAPSPNSLRSLRSLRSNSGAESVMEARCARGHEPCASRRLPGAPRPARTRLCCCGSGFPRREHRSVAAGGARWGRFLGRRGAQAWGRRAQRASLSDSPHLFERSERSERSELCGATPGRAPQRSRRAAPTAPA